MLPEPQAGPAPVWPPYCCVTLRDALGRFLLERRPGTARVAAGSLTCFGGTRNRDEPPEACVRRELVEELGPAAAEAIGAGPIELAVIVRTPTRPIAWFYSAQAPGPGVALICEPGYAAVWLSQAELASAPLARWHRAAITSHLSGEREAIVNDDPPRGAMAPEGAR